MNALSDDVRELLGDFARREVAGADDFPAANVTAFLSKGILAAPFPPELGGRAASLVDAVEVVEAVASVSASTALLLSMPLGLAGIYGAGPNVAPAEHSAAWYEQTERVAGDYRAGAIYAACNSEKGAGGALSAVTTRADRAADGVFHLTGEKILASFGKHAAWFFSTAKVNPAALPGCGAVEIFFVDPAAPGVQILSDWDGFGMRSTESRTVRYAEAAAREMVGFPNFIEVVQPLTYWFCLFAAIPLGCARAMLQTLGTPAPVSAALRLRLSDGLMRYEALHAYLAETAARWRPGAGAAFGGRVLRMKTYVTQEATRLCAELFGLSGGRHYARTGRLARALADAFAGTALRPPLALALDTLVDQFTLGSLAQEEP